MTRITNDLFEAIRKVTAGQQEHQLLNEEMKEKEEKGEKKHKEEKEEMDEGQVDKAHYCATHVEHSIFGEGECIAEAHADPDADGNIEWYTVQFSDGIRKVYTEALKVKKAKMHEHAEVSNDVVAETEQTNEAIYVPPVSHVSPKKPSSSSKDEDNRKASMLIDKIRSFRQLKQDYKEKGNLERHREFHTKLHNADKEYQKLGHKSLLRKDDHVMEEELEQIDELSPSTLTSYRHKARNSELRSAETARRDTEISQQTTNPTVKAKSATYAAQAQATAEKRRAGQQKATSRLSNMGEGAMSDIDADRKDRAYQTRQAKTTMKHISNPTPGEKDAAKDIKPGIAGYRDRIAMLKSAQARGALKEDEVTEGKGDGNLANNYPPYDKVTKGDVVSGRLGKDHMGGKNKRAMVKETLTLIYEQDIDLEIPAELTFADYLDAVKSLAKDDPTISEADIIRMATLAHKENDVDVVLEAAYNRTREGDKMYSPELDADIDRSKPGVTRFSRRIKSGEGMGVKQSERKLMKRIASRNK